jgi:large subunit ribosomal protein L1
MFGKLHSRKLLFQRSRFFSQAQPISKDVETKPVVKLDPVVSITKPNRHNKKELNLGKLNVHDAIDALKKHAWAKFDETVEIIVNLGVDPRKPNQSVKGTANLPNGTGKSIRIAVFARNQDAQEAITAGATIVGAEDLIDRIQAGDISFDRTIATPEMMSLVSKIGRILGPRGSLLCKTKIA